MERERAANQKEVGYSYLPLLQQNYYIHTNDKGQKGIPHCCCLESLRGGKVVKQSWPGERSNILPSPLPPTAMITSNFISPTSLAPSSSLYPHIVLVQWNTDICITGYLHQTDLILKASKQISLTDSILAILRFCTDICIKFSGNKVMQISVFHCTSWVRARADLVSTARGGL